MSNWSFKGCPRCGGDMYADRDDDGDWYEHCLQCSHRNYLVSVPVFKLRSGHYTKFNSSHFPVTAPNRR